MQVSVSQGCVDDLQQKCVDLLSVPRFDVVELLVFNNLMYTTIQRLGVT
jgi:hypothetical protein